MISSKRTLGQDKKEDDSPKTPPVAPATMSATYYQQPSTGQVPYYNMDSYYQGYYNTGAYQQWGQGQWPSTSQATGTVQPATGAIQYPAASQYAQYSYGQYPAGSTSTTQNATGQGPASTTASTATTEQNTATTDTTQTDTTSVTENTSQTTTTGNIHVVEDSASNTAQTSPTTGTTGPPDSQDTNEIMDTVEVAATAQEAPTPVAQDNSNTTKAPLSKGRVSRWSNAFSSVEVEQETAKPESMETTVGTPDVVVMTSDELRVVHSETVQAETIVEQAGQTVEEIEPRVAPQTTVEPTEPQKGES